MTISVETSLTALAAQYAAALPWRVWFTPRSRWSKCVHRSDETEVWLLGWLPGQGTELHDHGGHSRPAPAAFAVARGQLTEYRVVPGEFPRLESQVVAAGGVREVDARGIHAVRNTGDEPAVSVHVYAPRLELMRRYLFDETGLWLASIKRAGADWLLDRGGLVRGRAAGPGSRRPPRRWRRPGRSAPRP